MRDDLTGLLWTVKVMYQGMVHEGCAWHGWGDQPCIAPTFRWTIYFCKTVPSMTRQFRRIRFFLNLLMEICALLAFCHIICWISLWKLCHSLPGSVIGAMRLRPKWSIALGLTKHILSYGITVKSTWFRAKSDWKRMSKFRDSGRSMSPVEQCS